MRIVHKWIFPILRIGIFLVIAAALGKLAFFSGALNADKVTVPTGQVDNPLATVETGTITNNLALKATVAEDASTPLKATAAGDVKKILIAVGKSVVATTPVLTIHTATAADDGSVVNKTVTVLAGAVGVLSAISVQVGQIVAVGDTIGQVSPTTFSVMGSVAPEQQYRLINRPTEGQVMIAGGPAAFTCTALTISSSATQAAPAAAASDPSAPSASGAPTVRCSIPAAITVFSGLSATLTIAGGVATDALIVPVTAVEGLVGSGSVYFLKPDGTSEKIPVTLGLTDGVNVQITAGVKKGDKILQFVPGAPAHDDMVMHAGTDN